MTQSANFPLLAGTAPLYPGDAVAALILVEGSGYLMQLRDSRPDIWYPGHWGLFGGGVEPGEDPLMALARELKEELELELHAPEFFAEFHFDLRELKLERYFRRFYIVPISHAVATRLVLHEGAEMQIFAGESILREPRVTPYDSFALFLHYSRHRLAPKGACGIRN
ncbi:MAG TPA: NUDIX domain-containing protein [Stellaceae bacterium]|nr:NUDIX domain-containing protein [Stellaceae bacterium]